MFVVLQQEVDDLLQAFAQNPNDLGVGICNPTTGEIHIASFDRVAPGGHLDLVSKFGLDPAEWRGFVVSSDGQYQPISHLNGLSLRMDQPLATAVEELLRKAGLVR